MQAVILAAGLGKRLRPLTDALPKGLIEIGGRTLLEYSLDALVKNGIKKIVIVTGFLDTIIEQKIGSEYRGSIVKYVLNKEYSRTGSMYSFSQSRGLIDEDVILLESDLLYDPEVIETIMDSPFENTILVAEPSGSGDEVFVCVDEDQRVIDLGKNVSSKSKKNALGELVGISRFSKVFLEELFERARNDYQNDDLNYHYEECVFAVSRQKSPVYALLCKDLAWIEIDNEADMERAKGRVYSQISRKSRHGDVK